MGACTLQSRPAVQLVEQHGAVVVCEQGKLWVTDQGEDIFLEHGQRHQIQTDEPVVIESLQGDGVFHLENAHATDADWSDKVAKALHDIMHPRG